LISKGIPSVSLEDIYKVTTEAEILFHYLGITKIPCRIHSPLRVDNKPSVGLFSPNGTRITWIDFSTGERGGIFDLLSKMWNCTFRETLARIYKEFIIFKGSTRIEEFSRLSNIVPVKIGNSDTKLECKTREWCQYDIDYWKSYGITKEWLIYANVYPISHKIIIKDGKRQIFVADKYAYAYVEFKDGNTTLKIYQPYNTKGFKWTNKHSKSVISLWTKVPKKGNRICICSSVKDALCLWSNTGIPSIAIQGEGYSMSNTAISELKKRFNNIYILLDNDEPGIKDAEKLASETGFTNIVLPKINGAKDISDLYLSLQDTEKFKTIMLGLFN
jgi:hypothetical protein